MQHGTHASVGWRVFVFMLVRDHTHIHVGANGSGPPALPGRRAPMCTCPGELVFKAHRLVYHATLGWRVIKKKKAGDLLRREHRGVPETGTNMSEVPL